MSSRAKTIDSYAKKQEMKFAGLHQRFREMQQEAFDRAGLHVKLLEHFKKLGIDFVGRETFLTSPLALECQMTFEVEENPEGRDYFEDILKELEASQSDEWRIFQSRCVSADEGNVYCKISISGVDDESFFQ